MENSISLSDFGKVLWKFKYVVLSVVVVFMVVGLLVFGLAVNPKYVTYNSRFTISFPMIESEKYPDGTDYLLNDIIEYDILLKAKESNSDFSNIDVEKMFENNDAKITVVSKAENGTLIPQLGMYDISILRTYFNGKNQAADYFEALIRTFTNSVYEKAKNISFDDYLDIGVNAVNYDIMFSNFDKERLFLVNSYDKLIEAYGDITYENHQLSYYRDQINNVNNNHLDLLLSEINTKGYVLNFEKSKPWLISQRSSLVEEKERNEAIISSLYSSIAEIRMLNENSDVEVLQTEIIRLSSRNAEIDQMIGYIDLKLENKVVPQEFLDRVDEEILLLGEYSNELQAIWLDICESKITVDFELNSIVYVSGETDLPTVGLIFAIVGLLSVTMVFGVIALKKK